MATADQAQPPPAAHGRRRARTPTTKPSPSTSLPLSVNSSKRSTTRIEKHRRQRDLRHLRSSSESPHQPRATASYKPWARLSIEAARQLEREPPSRRNPSATDRWTTPDEPAHRDTHPRAPEARKPAPGPPRSDRPEPGSSTLAADRRHPREKARLRVHRLPHHRRPPVVVNEKRQS